jgi:sulfur-oxidizing protein SoxA
MSRTIRVACAALLVGLTGAHALAQEKTSIQAIEEYREMLQDGNPADLFEAKGEELWKKARGPRNASLERCDLGLGPGVVKGAFVQLPRYLKDTGKVQDLESRLVTCMTTLQGIEAKDIVNGQWGRGERANTTALATWIAAQSKGMAFNLPQSNEQERVMYQVGKRLFYQRGGAHDFACASCHGEEGKRISNGQMWTMQHRLNDCYRQQRFPEPDFASDVTVALGVYLGVNAKGAKSAVPTIKR